MERITVVDLRRIVSDLDVSYDTWSPGDGRTRYRFCARAGRSTDYFGCEPLFTAFGVKEAYTWAQGYRAAYFKRAARAA